MGEHFVAFEGYDTIHECNKPPASKNPLWVTPASPKPASREAKADTLDFADFEVTSDLSSPERLEVHIYSGGAREYLDVHGFKVPLPKQPSSRSAERRPAVEAKGEPDFAEFRVDNPVRARAASRAARQRISREEVSSSSVSAYGTIGAGTTSSPRLTLANTFWLAIGLVIISVALVEATRSSYWYCSDSGPPNPHHFESTTAGDHRCSQFELWQSGLSDRR